MCKHRNHNKGVISLNTYTIIAGVNGTGKSSFRGVLDGQNVRLGHIIDPDLIAKENNNNIYLAGKVAISKINDCLDKNISFTQETTLSGHMLEKTMLQARKQGYYIIMYYIGLSSDTESINRIANRVKKGGHYIPSEDVTRRFNARFTSLLKVIPYCDEIHFYDNENGFVKVAEIINNQFRYINGYRPNWITQVKEQMKT